MLRASYRPYPTGSTTILDIVGSDYKIGWVWRSPCRKASALNQRRWTSSNVTILEIMQNIKSFVCASHSSGVAGAGWEEPSQGSPQSKSPDYSATNDKETTELKQSNL